MHNACTTPALSEARSRLVLILLALCGGLRQQEITWLEWKDADLEAGLERLRKRGRGEE